MNDNYCKGDWLIWAFILLTCGLALAVFFDVAWGAARSAVTRGYLPNTIPGLVLALDAAVECDGVADGTAVATWEDQSGAGRNATQATAGSQPTCQTGSGDTVNGHGVVRLDGVDDFMVVADDVALDGGVGLTVVVVLKQAVLAVDQSIATKWVYSTDGGWSLSTDGSTNTKLRFFVAPTANDTGGNWQNGSTALSASAFAAIGVVYDGTQSAGSRVAYYKNGAAAALATATNGTVPATLLNSGAALNVGAFGGSLTRYFNGDIAALLIYNRALSAAEWAVLSNRYVAGTWGVGVGAATSRTQIYPAAPAVTPGNCTDANVAAYFTMDAASGNLTVPSGCAASGTVFTANGSPKYSREAPMDLGASISFDGAADYFQTAGDVAALDFTTNGAVVEGWLYYNAGVGGCTYPISKWSGTAGWTVEYCRDTTNGDQVAFFVDDGPDQAKAQTSYLNTGATGTGISGYWHYMRAVWTPGTKTATIALSGPLLAAGTPSGTATNASVDSVDVSTVTTLGALGASATGKFIGSIADLRITIGNSTNNLAGVGPLRNSASGRAASQ